MIIIIIVIILIIIIISIIVTITIINFLYLRSLISMLSYWVSFLAHPIYLGFVVVVIVVVGLNFLLQVVHALQKSMT
jgi:hypothetical protein